jgi:hypothetical protein
MRKNRMTKKRNGGGKRWEKFKSLFRRKSNVAPANQSYDLSIPSSNLTNYGNINYANQRIYNTARAAAFRSPSTRFVLPRTQRSARKSVRDVFYGNSGISTGVRPSGRSQAFMEEEMY